MTINETAFAAALKKAGVEAATSQLFVRATDAISASKGDLGKALSSFVKSIGSDSTLRGALALDYLRRVSADMAGKSVVAGLHSNDTRSPPAGADAPSDGPAFKFTPRSEARKRIAREAASGVAADIFIARKIGQRDIGDLRYYELADIVLIKAQQSAEKLILGRRELDDAIVLHKILQHVGRPANEASTIREMIKADDLKRFVSDAKTEAPLLIKKGIEAFLTEIRNENLIANSN